MSERRIIKLELEAGLLLFSTGIELAFLVSEATTLKVGRILALLY